MSVLPDHVADQNNLPRGTTEEEAATSVNQLTGTGDRMRPPVLGPDVLAAIKVLCRSAVNSYVEYGGRSYWADPNGEVFVVAWRDSRMVSGDPVGG